MPASKKEKEQCEAILAKISDLVPGHYVQSVQERMKKIGWEVSTPEQIRNVRQGRVADLRIVSCLQEITKEHWAERGVNVKVA